METLTQLVKRSEVASVSDSNARIQMMYELVYSRLPTPQELEFGAAYLRSAEQSAPIEVATLSPWQYGYGEFDAAAGKIKSFQTLGKWTGQAWQGGDQLPDPQIGWVMIHSGGGHPGNDLQHALIQRWTAPHDGVVKVRGRLRHRSDEGDGVECRVVSNRSGLAGNWTAQKSEANTNVDHIEVKAGDVVDFYTDCRTNPNNDSFLWNVKLEMEPASPGSRREWSSRGDFHGPAPETLPVWERYVQVLLMANEFVFVD
jgi:hypothetical protein